MVGRRLPPRRRSHEAFVFAHSDNFPKSILGAKQLHGHPLSNYSKLFFSQCLLQVFGNAGFIFRNDICIKAVRNFITKYGDVPDVTWRQSSNGAAAYFTTNDIMTSVYFHKNGDYRCIIRYYREDKLPQYIRHLVKSHYYDYAIFSVAELNENGKTIYDVKIEDKRSYKTIRLIDGEMEVSEEFFKL